MSVIRNLIIRAGVDMSGMRRDLQRVNTDLREFGRQARTAVAGITATLGAIGVSMGLKTVVEDAMKVEASMQQVNRMMGNSAAEFANWAKVSASAFNMSRSEAIRYGATFSNLVSTFESNTTDISNHTKELLKASSVIAAATGRDMDDVLSRITSGMLGNTEAIEDLGVNVNASLLQSTEAFKKFANGKSWDQLDFKVKQQIIMFGILEQTTKKYGDTLADNTASRLGAFTTQLKNVQLSLGQAFLSILNVILPSLTTFATSLSHIMSVVAQFSQALFGKADMKKGTKAADAQAAAVGNLGDSYKSAGKAAQGALAGFDEIHSLSDSSGGGDASSASGAGAGVDNTDGDQGSALDSISAGAQAAANKIKEIWSGLSSFIKEHKDIIIAALGGIAAGFATFLIATNWAAIIAGISFAVDFLAASFLALWAAITAPIALIVIGVAALVAAFIYFYRTNETFRGVVDGILRAIGDAAVWLWNNALVPLGQWLGTVFVAAWKVVTVAVEWLWKNVMVPFGNFLIWFWNNVIIPISKVLGDYLGIAFSTVSDIAKSFWKEVLVPLGNFFKDILGPTVEALSAVFEWLWKNVLQPFGEYLGTVLKQVFSDLTTVIVYLWNNVLEPLALFVGGHFKQTFETVFKSIGGAIDGFKTAIIGLMTFITGVFTGNWEKAWNGVKGIFEGVFKSLYSIVKAPLDLIVDAINGVISGLNSIHIDMPKWMGGGSFGLNIPTMPKLPSLDVGTNYVQSGGLAMIHEGEAVVPKKYNPAAGGDNTSLVDAIQSAVATAVLTASNLGGNNNSRPVEVTLNIDGTAIARAIAPYLNKENNRVGGAMIRTT